MHAAARASGPAEAITLARAAGNHAVADLLSVPRQAVARVATPAASGHHIAPDATAPRSSRRPAGVTEQLLRTQQQDGNANVECRLADRRMARPLVPRDPDHEGGDQTISGGLRDAVLARTLGGRLQRSFETAGTPGNRPNLDVGDTGPGVKLLQSMLGVPSTGTFDEATRKAAVAFQESRPSLHPATGGVGPMTWAALDETTGATSGGPATGAVVVGDTDLGGPGNYSVAMAGGVVVGAAPVVAQGIATIAGTPVAGGGKVTLIRQVARAAAAATDDVAGPARYLAPEAAKRAGVGIAARGGLLVLGMIVVAGTIYFVTTSISRVEDAPPTAEAPPGGAPQPAVDPGDHDSVEEPHDAGAPPAKAPGAAPPEQGEAPGGPIDAPAECARLNHAHITHDHHIYPQSLREQFSRIGMDVDDYTITIPWDKHIGANGVHTVLDWNSHWHVFFDDLPARALSPAEQQKWQIRAKDEAMQLLYHAKLLAYKIHPYRR